MNLSHPRLQARGTDPGEKGPAETTRLRALVYSPTSERLHAIVQELVGVVAVQLGHSVSEVASALVEMPPPRPQVLVLDIDLVTAGELLHLHTLRERGWCGSIVAIGTVPAALARSLNIDHVVPFAMPPNTLREAIGATRFAAQTLQIPVLRVPADALPESLTRTSVITTRLTALGKTTEP